MCRKSNVLYNWECTVKYICPDSGYDGQSSKNNFTCSSQHTSLYESWKRHEDGTGETSQSHSFLYDHQIEDHNGVPPKFKLQSKRYYGKDWLVCQVAEGVSIKMRTGKILNSKTDWDAPSLITIERNIHRGLWLWLEAIQFLNIICTILVSTCWYSFIRFAQLKFNVKSVLIDKARCAKHVSSISLNKFCTTTIRKEKDPQKYMKIWIKFPFIPKLSTDFLSWNVFLLIKEPLRFNIIRLFHIDYNCNYSL